MADGFGSWAGGRRQRQALGPAVGPSAGSGVCEPPVGSRAPNPCRNRCKRSATGDEPHSPARSGRATVVLEDLAHIAEPVVGELDS